MSEPKTTCQICGRGILAKTGLIAHHGYKRPGNGWQTASCFGAKYRPYEVACDAIAAGIAACERYIAATEVRIAGHLEFPPAQFIERDSYGRVRCTVLRPEGFDPAASKPCSYRQGSPEHYACSFHYRTRELRNSQDAARADIAFMSERLAAWKPQAA